MMAISTQESVFITNIIRGLEVEEDKLSFLRLVANGGKFKEADLIPCIPTDSTIDFLNKVKKAISDTSPSEESSPKGKGKGKEKEKDSLPVPVKAPASSGSKKGGKQCKGIVKKTGERCTHPATDGSDYCGVHSKGN